MKNKAIVSLLCMFAGVISMPAQSATSVGYWYDTSGEIVRTGFGECWRSIRWSSNNALAECDGKVSANKVAELDSDEDSVIDRNDQCPGTAAGVSVDTKGCARDSDNDGVTDNKDKCPGSAKNARVDATGCVVNNDADKDGIVNANDDCPGTAAGTAVNARGCELKASKISLKNVQFQTGTDVLSNKSRSILDNVAQTLKENKHLSFDVAGHTDSSGNYKNNVKLSEKRAKSVRQYLIDSGVAADRLSARGYGPDKPVASNNTKDGRAQNRRVELVLK